MHLEIDEISALFKSMDINGNGSINYTELVEMFASINTAQIIRKMQRVIQESGSTPEFYFNHSCFEDTTK